MAMYGMNGRLGAKCKSVILLTLFAAGLSLGGCGIFPDGTFGPRTPQNGINVVIEGPSEIGVKKVARFSAARSISDTGQSLTVAWALADKPIGSLTTINSATGIATSFFVDKGGYYVLEATVTDPNGAINTKSVVLEALGTGRNHPPVAIIKVTEAVPVQPQAGAGGAAPTPAPSVFILDGSQSYDIDGGPIRYEWVVSGAFNSDLPMTDPSSPTVTVTAYNGVASLRVFDGADYDEASSVFPAPTAGAARSAQ